MTTLPDDLLIVGTPLLRFFVLKDGEALYLIDSGFVDGPRLLRAALKRRGWDRLPVCGILLTHGHLDHMLNTVPFAERYGAWVAAPRLDAAGCAGTARYRGRARVTNVLEAVGRKLFRFRPFAADRWIDPGTTFPIWGGLRAVPLPGHTPGHMGFLAERHNLLFSGDLFNSSMGLGIYPFDIFNADPKGTAASIAVAAGMDLAGVIPNHGDDVPPAEHLRRLRALSERLRRRGRV